MIRITIAILTIITMIGCQGLSKSPLVLSSDLWVVERNAGGCKMQSESKSITPSLEFLNDGTFIGISCCDSFSGVYTTLSNDSIDSIDIVIEYVGPKMRYQNGAEHEHEYVECLKQIRSYVVKDGRLELRNGVGACVLSFVRASANQK